MWSTVINGVSRSQRTMTSRLLYQSSGGIACKYLVTTQDSVTLYSFLLHWCMHAIWLNCPMLLFPNISEYHTIRWIHTIPIVPSFLSFLARFIVQHSHLYSSMPTFCLSQWLRISRSKSAIWLHFRLNIDYRAYRIYSMLSGSLTWVVGFCMFRQN